MTLLAYDRPVSLLLDQGHPDALGAEKWADYPTQFGLTRDHIPALVQLLPDEALWALWTEADSEAFTAAALPSDAGFGGNAPKKKKPKKKKR
jgi:hypothetical protein